MRKIPRRIPPEQTDALLVCLFEMLQRRPCRRRLPCFATKPPVKTLTAVISECWQTLPQDNLGNLQDFQRRLAFCLFATTPLPDYKGQSTFQFYELYNASELFFPAEYQDERFYGMSDDWSYWQDTHPLLLRDPVRLIRRLTARAAALSKATWRFCLFENMWDQSDLTALDQKIFELLSCGCDLVAFRRRSADKKIVLTVRYQPSDPLVTFAPA